MSCAVCGRAGRGFGFQAPRPDPFTPPPPRLSACTMRCLDILARSKGHVFSLNHFEDQAIRAASDAAGEYLDALGKTDLATMSRDEWRQLLEVVFVRATATIQRLTDEEAVPF